MSIHVVCQRHEQRIRQKKEEAPHPTVRELPQPERRHVRFANLVSGAVTRIGQATSLRWIQFTKSGPRFVKVKTQSSRCRSG